MLAQKPLSTKNIAESLFKTQDYSSSKTNNSLVGGVIPSSKESARSSVIEIKKAPTTMGYEYVFTDKQNNKIVGVNSILNHFIQRGYRIINTIESGSNEDKVMQIIIEK